VALNKAQNKLVLNFYFS